MLHALALGLIRIREKPAAPPPAKPLVLQWVRLPATTATLPPQSAPTAKTAANTARARPEAASPPATPRAADLITSARATVQAEIHAAPRMGKPSGQDTPALAERPFMPQLESALRREKPGERYLGNGIIRIVTASGHSYCLKEPPPYARDIPSVPTNCP